MPTFEITSPDGKKYRVTGENADGAYQALQSHIGGGQAEQPKQGMMSGLADSFTQGISFGFGDELTALEAGVLGKTPDGGMFDYSQPFGERYDAALQAERGQQDQFAENNPASAIGAQIAGGLVTGAGLAKGGATLVGRTAGKGLLTRMGAGAAEGAAYGGAYGAGNADENSRLGGAAGGAALGATLGGAIPAVGAGVKKVAGPIAGRIGKALNPVSAQNSAASERVLADAKRAGLSADDLVAGVREGRTVGQQDVMLSDLTRAVKRQPGEARKTIDSALNAGYEANNKAAKDAVSKGLGAADNFYVWLDAFAKSKSKGAKAAYDVVFKQNWGTKGPPFALDDIVKSGRIPAEALRSAQRMAQADGRPFGRQLVASIDDATGEVTFARLPSLEEAEIIRRGLDAAASKAYKNGDGGVGAAYRGLERELRSVLDGASDGLKKVRAQYATSSQIQRSADDGLSLLNKSADEVEFIISGKSPNELQAMRMAVASDMKNKVERGLLNRDAVRQIFGSERNRRIYERLWPSKGDFAKFQKQMENSAEFSAFRQNVQGNSRTQQDLADSAALGGGMSGVARNLLTGNFKGAAIDAIVSMSGRFINPAKGLPEQQLRRMAQILVERDPRTVQKLLARAQAGDQSAHRQLEMQIRQLMDNPQAQRLLTVGTVAATQ